MIDPSTGHSIDPTIGQKNAELAYQQGETFEDPLEQQFLLPDNRGQRHKIPAYLSQSGVPLYKYRNKRSRRDFSSAFSSPIHVKLG